MTKTDLEMPSEMIEEVAAFGCKVSLFGCRVATQVDCATERKPIEYTAAHTITNGKEMIAMCKITAFVNNKYGKANSFVFSAFGTLADTCAKAMSPGKEFNCVCSLNSFQKGVYKDCGFTIENMTFNGESS